MKEYPKQDVACSLLWLGHHADQAGLYDLGVMYGFAAIQLREEWLAEVKAKAHLIRGRRN